MSDTEKLFVGCSCNSPEHQMLFIKREWLGEIEYDVEFYLSKSNTLWQRIIVGIKYIFGYNSSYGDWGNILLDDKTRKAIVNFLQ